MFDLFLGQLDRWVEYMDALETEKTKDADEAATRLIDSMLAEGFDATTDYPACLIYDRLLKRFPNAKVVLTVRSTPEKWADSVLRTIGRYKAVVSFPMKYIMGSKFAKLHLWIWKATPQVEFLQNLTLSRNSLIEAHEEWKARVMRTVPKDRLLVFDAKEGWEPLCSFLGLPVPENPYPRVNSGEEMGVMLDRWEFVVDNWWLLALVFGFLAYCSVKACFGGKRSSKPKQQ